MGSVPLSETKEKYFVGSVPLSGIKESLMNSKIAESA